MAALPLFPYVHARKPFTMEVSGEHYTVSYVPGESSTYVFGCNSNWRGPIWLCGKWSGGVVPSSLAQMIVALTLLLYTFLFLLTHFFCLTTFSVYHHTPEQFS